jgi:hypothetical protein
MVSPGRTTLSAPGRRAGAAPRQTGGQSFPEVVNLTHGISAASWVPASLVNRIGCDSNADVEVADLLADGALVLPDPAPPPESQPGEPAQPQP